jgi:hypothetical protein
MSSKNKPEPQVLQNPRRSPGMKLYQASVSALSKRKFRLRQAVAATK